MNIPIEKLLLKWIEKTESFVLLIDKKLTCASLNKKSCKFLFAATQKTSSAFFLDFLKLSEMEKSAVQKNLTDALQSQAEVSLQLPTFLSENEATVIDWSFTPISDSENGEQHLLAIGCYPKFHQKEKSISEYDRFAFIIENLPLMVVALDQNEKVIVWNKRAVTVTGYSLSEIQQDNNAFESLLCRRDELANARPKGESDQRKYVEKEIQTKNGKTKHIQWTCLSEKIPIPEFKWWGLGFDVTEQYQVDHECQQLQVELFLAQKMESIGALAGGVAHDFNNLLVGILGYASLLQTILPVDGEAFQCSQEIAISAQRMSKLTRQLMIFSRGGKFEPVSTDINSVISNTIAFVGRTIDPYIQILTNFEKPLPLILADPVQLQQVIVNLISNSAESIKERGFIKISTKHQSVIKGGTKQTKVLLTVEDSGIGMDKLTREKAFEPFYSTKSQGRGLGMAVVYRIVKIHNGEIFINSKPGRGSTVSISFPATQKPAEPEKEKRSIQLARGTESILVIDDEQVTLDIIKFSLERAGYKIYTAIDGPSGMNMLKENSDIALIILDVVMPGISGVPLFKRLKKIKQDVQVLLCSGYDETGPAKDILHLGANGFLHKPFEVTLLADVIKKILYGDN